MARILIASKYYHPFRGGIEDNARGVAEHLAQHHAVTVVAFCNDRGGATRTETIGGVTVERASTPLVIKSQPLSLAYCLAILRTRADLIYFHAPNVLGSAAVLAKLALTGRRVKLVTMHHMDIHGRPALRAVARWLYDRILRRSDRVIVTSLKNAAVSADIRTGIAPTAIPLGITPADFRIADGAASEARAWKRSICGDAPAIVFVGRHARYKGLDVLMRALADLPGVHGLIAGEGPYRAPTQALVAELGIADRVHFLGGISHADKLRLLAAADVFAFPSTEITEAFGVAQLEAMLMGAPVVAGRLPTGVTDVAIDEETALLVPPGDAAALAGAIRRLLADHALAARLADRARRAVLANFTTEVMARRNQTLIDEVLAPMPAETARVPA